MTRHSQEPLRLRFRLASCLLLLFAAFTSSMLHAQTIDFNQFPQQPLPDSAAPLVRAYGFNDNEFSIGAYVGTNDSNNHVAGVWNWAEALGIRIIELRTSIDHPDYQYDTLANLARGYDAIHKRFDQGLIISSWPWDRTGNGKQVNFFAFDTSESYYWRCKFLQYQHGVTKANPTQLFGGVDSMYERQYSAANCGANDTVLAQIVFGYDPAWHKYRYQPPGGIEYEDSVQTGGNYFYQRIDLDPGKRYLWFDVTAHLFDTVDGGQTAQLNDTLLAVDIWNEIPHGTTFLPAGTTTPQTAVHDTAILYTTIHVQKRSLFPVLAPDSTRNFNAYRDTAYRVDMVQAVTNGLGGAWNDANSSHGFDVRVRWTGKEKAALRSVTIRDVTAQLAYGSDSDAIRFRDTAARALMMTLKGGRTTRRGIISSTGWQPTLRSLFASARSSATTPATKASTPPIMATTISTRSSTDGAAIRSISRGPTRR
ncbi:MAG TPA: hypothetical protein VHI13_13525 [Candidatus Kapabacteria bacterium]|nr:hypothetical protein [Candidatus Kapabacteria bacterium]